VRVFHVVSSPADPDQADGHEPRPSVTIRQHSRLAAVVGLMVGPTTHLQPGRSAVAQPGCAAPSGRCAADCAAPNGCCANGLRNRSKILCSRLRRGRLRSRRVSDLSCAGLSGALRRRLSRPGRLPSAHRCPGPVAERHLIARGSPHGGIVRRVRGPVASARLIHGWGHGWADHDPNHGLRVPIVTVVGGSWSVVGSGSTGFLKVSNIRSDLGV
jgi:hypothetical protein